MCSTVTAPSYTLARDGSVFVMGVVVYWIPSDALFKL